VRRFDPVSGEWRTFADRAPDEADAGCALCGAPAGVVQVREHRAPALVQHPPAPAVTGTALYPVAPAQGADEVVVYSGDHDVALGDMPAERIARVVAVWADRYAELGGRDDVAYVLVFETTAPARHPHGRIHAYPEIPPRARRELDVAADHIAAHGTCLYCDVVAQERAEGVRVVAANRSFMAFVPFAARVPDEVHVTSLRHAASLLDLSDPERLALAEVLRAVVQAYAGRPYVMAMHQAPTDDG
jgi:UDPglucose--hexose-1-phosphate uridylyltransferase